MKTPLLIWALVCAQCACGAYFLWEILASVVGLPTLPLRWRVREVVEMGASLGLVLGTFMGVRLAVIAGREMRRAETARRLTSGEFASAVEDFLTSLGLSPAEREVAWFLFKGMSVADIANMRGTREGTVRAQCTAIYKKANVTGKSQLFSLLVEDLLF